VLEKSAKPMSMRAVHVIVHGDVQGVGFRYYTRGQGKRIGVMGWVRNLRDGTVEGWAEGAPAQVEEWLAAVRRGPEGSYVRELEVHEETPQNLQGFEVRY
jgi:acylphosphatase